MAGATYRAEMDGLRGVACLIVLFFHAAAEFFPDAIWLLRGTARIGVWLFFVLSAFLLTLKLLDEGLSVPTAVRYVVDRFLRIIPLFIFAVVLYRVIAMLGRDMIGLPTWDAAIATLTFSRPAGHLWTIPPEFAFYAILPFLVFGVAALNDRFGARFALAALAAVMILVAGFVRHPHSMDAGVMDMWRYFLCFGFGVTAAFAVRFLPSPGPRVLTLLATAALGGLLVYLAVHKAGWLGDPEESISHKHAEIAAFWAVFAYATYSGRTFWSRILTFPLLAAFGLAIYSTYLFHWIFVDWLLIQPTTPDWWTIPASMALSILVGAMGYLALEQPLRQLRKPVANAILRLLPRSRVPVDN